MRRVLIIGLDGVGAEVLSDASLADLPNLASLVERGVSGPLRSTVPPITIPAWTSMFSGRDPGELGLYGFRNRATTTYDSMVRADSSSVRFPRLWDHVGMAGGRSLVVGVPQTFPPPHVQGDLISGFDTSGELEQATSSPALAAEVRELVGEYMFDISEFRRAPRSDTLGLLREMTERRLRVMARLLETRPWDLAIYCEIGPDRMHHCFWSDHDPQHPRHAPDSPFRDSIRDYYRLLDKGIGELLARIDRDTAVMVVSDHGAKAMQGGICINDLLRRDGWLVLREEPPGETDLVPSMIDWQRTRAWAYGGYYSRVFLNIRGREPEGIIAPEDAPRVRAELAAHLEKIPLGDGRTIRSQVMFPPEVYRSARGNPPDLMVFYDDLGFRSLGTVGHDEIWQVGNDTGADEANHAWDGIFVWAADGVSSRRDVPADILDIAPTLLAYQGIESPPGLTGRELA
jgi:predicted AlkP superfamily phosphohydrolase/phosphomutase